VSGSIRISGNWSATADLRSGSAHSTAHFTTSRLLASAASIFALPSFKTFLRAVSLTLARSTVTPIQSTSRSRSKRKAVDERDSAEPVIVIPDFLACSRAANPMGSAVGGFTNCAMMEWCR